jgi:hypothetical protein
MTPTGEEILAGLKMQEELKKQDEKNKKMLQSKQEYTNKWEQISFEQNATELELLEKSKENALTNLKEKAQKTEMTEKEIEKLRTQIKQFYSNKREKIEEAEENQLLAAQKAFMGKWEQKLFEQNATELELLEKGKEDAIDNAKERAKKLELTENELQKTITNIKKVYSNKRKNINKEELEDSATFWEQVAYNAKDAGITIKSVTQDMANSIVDMFDKNYQAELAFKEKTAKIKDDFKEQIQGLINKRNEELKAFETNDIRKREINKKYSELIANLKQEERNELTTTKEAYEDNRKSIKSVLKGMLIDFVTMLEKQVIAKQAAELAMAWAQSWWDWSAVARSLATIATSTAVFEGVKETVRSFHEGGVVPGPLGQERLILAKSGETVTPAGSNSSSTSGGGGGGYGTANITVELDGRTIAQAVQKPLLKNIRIKGGVRY